MISRRKFLAGLSTIPLLGHSRWAKGFFDTGNENRYYVFNHLRNVEDGETMEYVTFSQIERLLEEHAVRAGSTIIATGLRSGTQANPYTMPGELALNWEYGSAWNAAVTSPVDSSPVPLGKEDPIVTIMMGVLNEDSAHHFELKDAAGTVLWTFYEDDTVKPIVGVGFHNGFKELDHGLTDTLYECSRAARFQRQWSPSYWRKRLVRYMPNLQNDLLWANFKKSIASGALEDRWLTYIRSQGWPAAAVVLRGSFMNVVQFHMRELNQISVSDPQFEIGKGIHGPFKIRYGREVRQFIEPEDSKWTMIGFIWDFEHPTMGAEMKQWGQISDVFGHSFHLHGYRHDQIRMGHTLFSMLGSQGITVSLYPLSFRNNETAFFYNNDLKLLPDSLEQSSSGLRISIHNDGKNFVRDLVVSLRNSKSEREFVTIPRLSPDERFSVLFSGKIGKAKSTRRQIEIDPRPDFLEGGLGRKNNVLDI